MRNRHPKRLRRVAAAAAVALALALAWSAGSARAEDADDDEDVPLDSKIFRQFMKDLGLRRDGDAMIDFRERIIGGAVGNAIDRFAYGAVADFVLFHITTATFSFNWYVFNLADVAIVAGVIGLLFETLIGTGAAKAP